MIRAFSQWRAFLYSRTYLVVYFFMSVAVFINIVQFRVINSQSSTNYKALHIHETSDFLALGTRSESARGRWLPWITLSKIAPNSTIYIPEDGYFDWPERVDDKLHSYGNASEVFRTGLTSAKILEDINPENYIVASIEDVLATREPSFAFAMVNTGDGSLAPSSIPGMSTVGNLPSRVGTSFALVEWPEGGQALNAVNQQGEGLAFYGLLIEVSLLSDEVRAKLLGNG